MATQGTLYKNVSSGYRLQLEWAASQDKANNRSTIEVKLYWMSLGSSYTISSGTKSGRIEVGSNGADFSATASLNGNQKKLLSTYSRTVDHDSKGKLSIVLKGIFAANVTLSGTYYGTQTVSGTVTLDDIPRESSITSSLNFTAPNGFPISISRANSSFTHTVRLYVDGTLIKTETGIGTGITFGFTTDQMTSIFNKLAQRSSCPLQLQLDTYDGSTKIGSTKSYNGTVFAEDPSTNVNSPNFNIGDSYTASIARNNSSFKHKIKFSVGGVLIHTSPDFFDYTYVWTPTAAENTKAFDTVKTKNSTSSTIELITYYNGVQVDSSVVQNGTAYVTNSNPTFTAGFLYEDTNATTLALTGDKYSIIQKASIPKVTIPVGSKATGKNSASIVSYTASLDGETLTATYSSTADVVFTFKPVATGQNATLSITAVDSRGNTTRATKTVTVIPYSPPSMAATARRNNGFEDITKVNIGGSISALTVGGVNKNAVVSVDFRYKENLSTVGYPTTWTPFAITTNGLAYTATEQQVTLVQDKQYIFQFRVTDKIGATIVERTVNKGKPIFFVDEKLGAIGIGRFPTWSGALEMAGPLRNAGDIKALNPANELAEVYMGWKDNIARIRYGGTGSGAVNGFQIHGTGDKILLALDNSQNADFYGKVRVSGTEVALKGQYEIAPTTPNFENNYSSYFNTAYYKQLDGTVHFRGLLKGSSVGLTAFTLPPSCCPLANQVFYVTTRGGGQHRCDVNTNGTVVIHATEGAAYDTWWDISTIKFPTTNY
jgi:Siphovirus protein of unknown function (DUF859)